MTEHTCIKDDGGTPNRRCYACEDERKEQQQWIRKQKEERDARNALAARLRELEKEATPGPLSVNLQGGKDYQPLIEAEPDGAPIALIELEAIEYHQAKANADLFAELRNHLPLILRALEGK